jgi:hypothetical protein
MRNYGMLSCQTPELFDNPWLWRDVVGYIHLHPFLVIWACLKKVCKNPRADHHVSIAIVNLGVAYPSCAAKLIWASLQYILAKITSNKS